MSKSETQRPRTLKAEDWSNSSEPYDYYHIDFISNTLTPDLTISYIFYALALGCMLTFLLSRFAPNVPYTVAVFLLGIVFALTIQSDDLKTLGDYLTSMPYLLLFIFLPPLLFGDAMNLNLHHCLCTIPSSLILAGPGAVLGAFMLGACVKYMLPYNWSWSLCLAFGAILCSTDPVAIVAILKEAGAAPKLTYLVTQEALYNDAAALVLFNSFFNQLLTHPHDEYSAENAPIYYSKVFFLSPVLGFLIGFITVACLRIADRKLNSPDVTVQVALTICAAYLSFYIGEHTFHASGVVTCVVTAVVVAWLGKPLILEHRVMEGVWHTVEWIGNTLIFLLTGIIIVYGGYHFEKTYTDYAMVLVVYFLLQAIRVVIILLFYPYFSMSAAKVSPRQCVFLTWAALRGSVSVVLGMVLLGGAKKDEVDVTYEDGNRVFFIVGGVAALTLIVNATTSKSLLYALGLVEESSAEIRVMQEYARKHIQREVKAKSDVLMADMPSYDSRLVAELTRCVAVNSITMARSTKGSADLDDSRGLFAEGGSQTAADPLFAIAGLSARGMGNGSTRGDETVALRLAYQRYKTLNESGGGGGSVEDGSGGKRTVERADDNTTKDLMDARRRSDDCASSLRSGDLPLSLAGKEMLGLMYGAGLDTTALDSTGGSSSDNSQSKNITDTQQLLSSENAPSSPELDPPGISMVHFSPSTRTVPGHRLTNSVASTSKLFPGIRRNKPVKPPGPDEQPMLLKKSNVNTALAKHFRDAFLELVKAVYWQSIEEGRLPRHSSAALTLLYSIDVAHETHDEPGLGDWLALLEELVRPSSLYHFKYLTALLDKICSLLCLCSSVLCCFFRRRTGKASVHSGWETRFLTRSLLNYLDLKRDEHAVHILCAYVQAHESIQRKLPQYFEDVASQELAQILVESRENVSAAKAMFNQMDPYIVRYHLSKQMARVLLHTQEEVVETLQLEGILRPVDAEVLLRQTNREFRRLEGEWLEEPWGSGADEGEGN